MLAAWTVLIRLLSFLCRLLARPLSFQVIFTVLFRVVRPAFGRLREAGVARAGEEDLRALGRHRHGRVHARLQPFVH